MNRPFVSILIPCYNASRWLRATLESALAQTWSEKEILVINDGSTDDSRQIAAAYENRGVRVLDQANAGQSSAFNRGIAAARGDYLEFLDADDLLSPNKIESQLARLRTLSPGWLATCAWSRFQDELAKAVRDPSPVARDLAPVDWLVTIWERNTMMHGAAWLVPAHLVRRVGGWDERLSLINDFEFFSRLVLASEGVAYVPEATTYYRSGLAASVSGRRSAAAWASAFLSMRLGTERLLQHENSPRTQRACAASWRSLIFAAYPDAPALRREAEANLKQLGETLGQPPGGRAFTALSRVVGWRLARRLQRWRARRG